MPNQPETLYRPILDPRDPASMPERISPRSEVFLPLSPRRADRTPAWWRTVTPDVHVTGHFCLPDPTLRRMEKTDPLGLHAAKRAGVHAITTMDVPLYGFMTPGQRARAQALHLHRWLRTWDAAPREGLDVIPLLKALDNVALDAQLDLAKEQGANRVAFYARELLLEHRIDPVRRFVRGACRRGLRPLLLGAGSRRLLTFGPAELAGQHHYVLARRRRALDARGHACPAASIGYSHRVRRFLTPHDRRGLCTHNFRVLADRLRVPTPMMEA